MWNTISATHEEIRKLIKRVINNKKLNFTTEMIVYNTVISIQIYRRDIKNYNSLSTWSFIQYWSSNVNVIPENSQL